MKYKLLLITLFACGLGWGQVAVPMSNQANLTYTENFNDISNWTNNFVAGLGANRWSSVLVNSTGIIPDGKKTTKSSATFVTSTTGGIQKGTQALQFLSTGSTANGESVAVDLLLDFTNLFAGNLSFDWNIVDNGNGTRPTCLRVYWSIDNINFTELTNAQILDKVSPNSGQIINLQLPIQFYNSSTARIRFYNYSGNSTTGSGNRDKFEIDNISITAYSPNPSPATLPYTQNFEGVYNEWNIGSNTPNSWVVGSATNNGGSKALYVTNNVSANSYSNASSGTTSQTIASFQVDLSGIQNAELSFDWKAMGEENYDYGDVWINTGGNDILLSYMDPQIADSEQYGEFFNSSIFANKTFSLEPYVGGVVTLKFRWRCDDVLNPGPPFAIDNVSVTAIAPSVVPPTISTYYIGSVTSTSAVVGCNITAQGTNPITERGLCVSTTSNPTISNTKIISGSGTGSYDVSVTNLTMSTQYYVRAYAITSAGVYYSNQMDFTTANIGAPTASNASNITENSFTANWGSVAQATSYRLDVSTNATTFTNYEAFGPFVVFDFENGLQSNPNPNLTNAANTSAYIFAYGGPGNTGLVNYANDSGNGGQVKIVSGWHDGNDTKYWRVNISTLGKYNLKLSSKQRSDSNGPKNWKLQYSIGQDGSENWIDISGGTIVVADNYTSGYLNQISLPSQMENLSIVSLRWVMTSNTSVSNGTVTSAGVSNIDDIIVYGDSPQTLVIGYDNLTVNSTSKVVSGLNPNTNYYYRVRSVASNSISSNSNTISLSTLNRTTWNSSSWSNNIPTTSLDAVIAGNLTTSSDLACKDLTINSGTTLTIGAGKKLTVAGNLINNGSIVFKSDATGSALFDVFNGTQSGSGTVTAENYIPARRAFRFLSSPVTTTSTIKENWQENAGTTAGLGTHITGTGGASNGFDATETNNPSMFTFTNGAWAAVTNTNVNVLNAGTPYRLMVRGDRTTDLTTNTPTATPTTLRSIGTLQTGNLTVNLSSTANDFNFVANPYQAPIYAGVIFGSGSNYTNVNPLDFYVWDPTLGSRGAYSTVSISNGQATAGSSHTNLIYPWEAFFIRTSTNGAASITFKEAYKTQPNLGSARNLVSENSFLKLNLKGLQTNGSWNYVDGIRFDFASQFSNEVSTEDALKLYNLDEDVAIQKENATLFSVERRLLPETLETVALHVSKYRTTSYVFENQLQNISGVQAFLKDNYTNTQHELNGTPYPFTVDTAVPASTHANRFEIIFQPRALSTDDFANNIKLYPNPAKAGASFYLDGITEATVSVYNVVGQNIPVSVMSQGNATQVTPKTALSQGVYLVTITTAGKTAQVKWIVE